jgi:hypothetical protein
LTNRVGHILGTVRREGAATGTPAMAARRPLTAVVVPAEYTTWTDIEVAAEEVRIAVVDNDDTFRAGPLLEGEYLVAVVDESTLDLSAGLATLRAIAQQATRVSVSAGGANTVSVSIARGRR